MLMNAVSMRQCSDVGGLIMKGDNMLFAVIMAALLNVSASELEKAHKAFMNDLKVEEARK